MRALLAQPKQTQDTPATLGVATVERQGGERGQRPEKAPPLKPRAGSVRGHPNLQLGAEATPERRVTAGRARKPCR